jgi:hypothetical protein
MAETTEPVSDGVIDTTPPAPSPVIAADLPKPFPEWQVRVLAERDQLANRSHALRCFIGGPQGDELRAKSAGSEAHGLYLGLLHRQLDQMEMLEGTLNSRIALFEQLA